MTAKTIYTKLSGLRARTEPLPKPPASPLVLWAEAGIHLLLGAVLAGALILEDNAPFGVALVGAAGSGLYGASALDRKSTRLNSSHRG